MANYRTTKTFARQIAHRLQQNNGGVVLLEAPMGAGKTTLVGEIVKILAPDAHPCSPTFTIINQYSEHIYHVDLYRLMETCATAADFNRAVESIGLWDLIGVGNFVFIEWPQGLSFQNAVRVQIKVREDGNREFIID